MDDSEIITIRVFMGRERVHAVADRPERMKTYNAAGAIGPVMGASVSIDPAFRYGLGERLFRKKPMVSERERAKEEALGSVLCSIREDGDEVVVRIITINDPDGQKERAYEEEQRARGERQSS